MEADLARKTYENIHNQQCYTNETTTILYLYKIFNLARIWVVAHRV